MSSEEEEGCIPSNICEMCELKEYKYCCPGCLIRTCSLECCNKHKINLGCNGKRNRTGFVALNQFDDNKMKSGKKKKKEKRKY